MKSLISEARLKKEYKVKGVGALKIIMIFDSWNMKKYWNYQLNFQSSCYVKLWVSSGAVFTIRKNALSIHLRERNSVILIREYHIKSIAQLPMDKHKNKVRQRHCGFRFICA